ncbi:heat shock 70 kDa protein 12A-like [Saccostrea echinata]|uniref:heat shock 70 kDa protein 12A-like n=1 Tax=Saccostrea echinata TaxID=191078 RepID=UPI002A82B617|nr:heat shock 70 kDa protein 12A-like [Saccostrea echinata]
MASKTGGNAWIVAAIDFGTTYSGYAFSFSGDPLTFYSPGVWYSGQGGMSSMKTPTCLLLNPNQTFNSFGFKAEELFASLASEDEHQGYYFFQRFKMDLHFKNVRKDLYIDDVSGKSLSALKIFSLSIKYLKDHCLKTMKDRGIEPGETEIKYVLTVPAIWNDRSKKFMRTAAIEAGIKDNRLELALEPEAASVYCQRVPLENLKLGTGKSITVSGARYLVADIGGGTADFSVHEVDEDGSLTELYRASGGPYGGIYVDEKYMKIYDIIFGKGTLEKLRIDDMEEYLTILREFENKKRSITPDFQTSFVTKLSAVLNEKRSKEDRLKAIQSSYLRDQVTFVKDKLKIFPTLMKSFFEDTLGQIIQHVRKILETIENIQHILIVGGYGECSLLQEIFQKEFLHRNIIIPNECSLAVIKGAVLFGHNPLAVSSRILRYSYGVAVDPKFNDSEHPLSNKYIDEEGVARCYDVFSQLISKNTKLPSTGLELTKKGHPTTKDKKHYIVRLYCTEKDNPKIIDENFLPLGRLRISVPEHVKGRWSAEHVFTFGMTEIKISARVMETGEAVDGTFDLLE